MTALLVIVWSAVLAACLYLAVMSARADGAAGLFIDAGGAAPAWGLIFATPGVAIAGLNLYDHLALTTAYGLQYSHVAIGLVAIGLTCALLHKRVWLAARLTGQRTLGDLLGGYYGSVALRVVLLGILFLFSVPFAAYCLAALGGLADRVTGGTLPAGPVIWIAAFFLFLQGAIGGWRGTVYATATLSMLTLALLAFFGVFVSLTLADAGRLASDALTPGGIMVDRLPGVIQYSAGIGKEIAAGGIWTTVAVLSFAIALCGIALSPNLGFLAISTEGRRAHAFSHVWMVAGLAAGLLLLVAPILAAQMAPLASAGDGFGLAAFAERLAAIDNLLTVCFLLLLIASLQIGVAFFAASGAHIATVELIGRYILPAAEPRAIRLAARIALAAVYFCIAVIATFTPLAATLFASLALPLSAQLLPALLGMCWLPWLSRSAVLTGFVFGALLVVFTEAFGLILFEALFVELPWGRWPLTIHSAGWGLAFNLAACLLAAIFTRRGAERETRDRLHDRFRADFPASFGTRAARGAMWSLTLLWAFFALGPGAILGNAFFSRPVFAGGPIVLGLPSLLVWQILFWFLGVLIVWWLAYFRRLSVIDAAPQARLPLQTAQDPTIGDRRPPWLARLVGRVAPDRRAS